MKSSHSLRSGMLAAAVAVLVGVSLTTTSARQSTRSVELDADDIGGVVTGSKGPEAGVWVIAETTDLATKFAKIVVTDDQGRYVCLICQWRTIRCGSVGMAWWTRQRLRALLGSTQPESGDGANRAGRGAVLPRRPLVCADAGAREG